MKTSKSGLKALMDREGTRLVAYRDTKGIWTNGVGHTGDDVFPGQVVTTEQVWSWLEQDVKIAEDAVNTLVKVPLTVNQFDALVSFVYNIGVRAYTNSTLLKVLNLGKYEEAANQFARWNIPKEIIGRRSGEQAQFRKA